MASYVLCLVIFRILLPILLSICFLFRPSGLSAIYLVLLLFLPLVPVPTAKSMAGSTGIYLKVMMAISVLTTLLHLAFHIVLLAKPPYGEFLEKTCHVPKSNITLEAILRHVGFVRLDQTDPVVVVTWISPEILMLATSIACFFALRKLPTLPPENPEEGSGLEVEKKKKKQHLGLVVAIGRYVVLLSLCLAAVLRPSIIGGVYFLVFLSAATWWASYRQLGRSFAIFLRCLMVLVAIHIFVFYGYQLALPQEYLPESDSYARYFGLKVLINTTCITDPRKFTWGTQEVATYIFPVALLWLYYILALESKGLLKPQEKATKDTSPERKAVYDHGLPTLTYLLLD